MPWDNETTIAQLAYKRYFFVASEVHRRV